MATIDSLDKLFAHIQKQVTDALQTDVAEDTVELMKEHIQTDVYDKYEPTQYVRRMEDGGLIDDDNYLIEDIDNGVKITNITRDNGYATPSDPDRLVTPIVESGVGYTWRKSKIYQMQPYPRPFVRNTAKDLEEGKLKESMKKALEKRLGKDTVV